MRKFGFWIMCVLMKEIVSSQATLNINNSTTENTSKKEHANGILTHRDQQSKNWRMNTLVIDARISSNNNHPRPKKYPFRACVGTVKKKNVPVQSSTTTKASLSRRKKEKKRENISQSGNDVDIEKEEDVMMNRKESEDTTLKLFKKKKKKSFATSVMKSPFTPTSSGFARLYMD
ncbi:hypothetical protein RFI_29832 [Reticulomyxa filosa]|uniref:Uncharacterized protein n=1 Tax=Reticulomyxa filosa TaxID=46433 RepID=X6M3G1_RETFI|nr:hypothetical protein RFI_29832 [Reticulomyxa filosa]|eukprot:ETO07560.1 hypothetical protein RFI_29832 [Reticulomyxa filosa]